MAIGLVFMAATTGSTQRYLKPHLFLANNGYYRFDGFLSGSTGVEELSLMVRSGNVVGTATNTKLVFKSDSESVNPGVIVPRIYLGRLANWAPDSIDETLLVVIPDRIVGEGSAICAFWQWTVSSTAGEKTNVDITSSKMWNVENVAGRVSFGFIGRGGLDNFYFLATARLNETAERQQLTLAMKNPTKSSTGSLTLELQDLRPSPSERRTHGVNVNDSTTGVINDDNKIPGGSQNEGSSLVRSLVELSPRIVELTNKLNEKSNDSEQAVPDRDGMIAQLESKLRVTQLESKVAQLESQLRVAELESQLRAAQDEIKLLGTKLLEAERAHEKD